MRIAVSGSACQGKSTFIYDFLKEWPNYKAVDSGYRKIIKEKKAKHSKETTEELQWDILNSMIDDMQANCDKGNKVLFDRCPFDNIVYSIWANAKDNKKFTDKFIEKCIPLVRESMRMLDIIFFTPITKVAPVPIIKDEKREVDEEFIKEIDNIFKTIVHQIQKTGVSVFFPKDDSPGIIEIFGKPEERIHLARYYLGATGDLIGEEQSVISDLNLQTQNQVQDLLKTQESIAEKEKFEKSLYNNLIIPNR
jgi:hypothetical protein